MARSSYDNPSLWDEIMSAKSIQRLLFVENRAFTATGLADKLPENWVVGIIENPDKLLPKVSKLTEISSLNLKDLVISIDLGLSDDPNNLAKNDINVGLALLADIRKVWPSLPIIVHSNLDYEEFEPVIGIQILEYGASFIWLGDADAVEIYASALPLILKGCAIYSKKPSVWMKKIATMPSDPFRGKVRYWEVLNLMIQDMTSREIATKYHVVEGAVAGWLNEMATALTNTNLNFAGSSIVSDNKKNRVSLEHWAKDNQAIVDWYLRLYRRKK